MKLLFKYLFLFLVGAVTYYFIEIVWDGTSHWTMGALGGICFIFIGLINELLSWETPIWQQGIVGASIITVLEFISGLILNIWLKLGIWDYSGMLLNVCGQICLTFTCIWFIVAIIAIVLDDYIRYWIFKEEKPHYKIL